MNPTCPSCFGSLHKRTAHGWMRCECWWRSLLLRRTPSLLRGEDQSLPVSIVSSPPWSITAERHERGSWDVFRRQAWWSLAYAWGEGLDFDAVALDTQRLREINFERDDTYKALPELNRPGLLILVGGQEPEMYRNVIYDLAVSLVRTRRIRSRVTWTYGMPPAISDVALFPNEVLQHRSAPQQQAVVTRVAPSALPAGDDSLQLMDPGAHREPAPVSPLVKTNFL